MPSRTSPPTEKAPVLPLPDWAELTCSLIWAYDHEVPAYGYHRRGKRVNDSVAWFLRKGSATVKTEQANWRLEPGQWFLLPEYYYWQDFTPHTHLLSLCFRANWATGIPLFHHGDGIVLNGAEHPQLEKAARPLVRQCLQMSEHTQNQKRIIVAGTALEYFKTQKQFMTWLNLYAQILLDRGCVPSRLSVTDPRLLQAVRFLDTWPLADPLPEEELARQVGLSKRQLARLFHDNFDTTPSNYLTQLKLKAATSDLYEGKRTVKEIAYSLGFNSLSYFSTWFRKQIGRTPRDFQNRTPPKQKTVAEDNATSAH